MVADGGGRQRARLDDPPEPPYARQMPRLVSSGHQHWHTKRRMAFGVGGGGATAGRLAVITEEPRGEAAPSEYPGPEAA